MARFTFDPSGDLLFVLLDPNNSASTVTDEPGSTTISNGIKMRASSKHLILASRVFKAMLQAGRFLEGNTLASEKEVEIPLPDDNFAAFEIILNIIHGRTRRVPKTVDFGLLTKLSVLVDKYELHEPVEIFSDHWIQNIKGSFPKRSGPDLPSWLCIAWVFNQSAEFSRLTKLAELQSSKSLKGPDTENLPIPDSVLVHIEHYRTAAIRGVIALVQERLARYRGSKLQCDAVVNLINNGTEETGPFAGRHKFECDAMMLGSIEKIARDAGIEPPPPGPGYNGIVLETLCSKLSTCELRSLCDRVKLLQLERYSSYGSTPPTAHDFKGHLITEVQAMERTAVGLNIAFFRTKKA